MSTLGVDWAMLRRGCPRCGAQTGGDRGLRHHLLSVWCLNCSWGCSWSEWPAVAAAIPTGGRA